MAITLEDVAELRNKIAEDRKKLEEQEAALRVLESMLLAEQSNILRNPSPQVEIDLEGLNVPKHEKKQSLTDHVRNILPRFGNQEFGVSHVAAVLEQEGVTLKGKTPRARIADTLSKLVRKGEIARTYEGTGSEPHQYKVIGIRLVKSAEN